MKDPPMDTEDFISYIMMRNFSGKITVGDDLVIGVHTAHAKCKLEKIIAKFDKRSLKMLGDKLKYLKANEIYKVKIAPTEPLCIERFSDYPPLGRFILREGKNVVAIGIVQDLTKKCVSSGVSNHKSKN